MMKKMGIMGGTFNPIHNGHLIMAQIALEELELDKIIFVPSGKPKYKNNDLILDSNFRLKLVEKSIIGNDKFILSNVDIIRDGNTYTVDTLKDLKKSYADTQFYFIMGADSFLNIKSWYHYEEILNSCDICVASRPGEENDRIGVLIDEFKNQYSATVYQLDMPLIEISSTNIRNRFCQGKSIRYMIPDEAINCLMKEYATVMECWSRRF